MRRCVICAPVQVFFASEMHNIMYVRDIYCEDALQAVRVCCRACAFLFISARISDNYYRFASFCVTEFWFNINICIYVCVPPGFTSTRIKLVSAMAGLFFSQRQRDHYVARCSRSSSFARYYCSVSVCARVTYICDV